MEKRKLLREIQELGKNEKNKASSLIARNLQNDFLTEEWHTAKEIAELSFVSEGTVTNFSKRLGFDGYQDLLWNLKNISCIYDDSKKEDNSNLINIYNRIITDFLSNEKEAYVVIEDLVKNIKNSKNIFIYSSYQLDDLAAYFIELIGLKKQDIFHNNTKLYAHKNIKRITKRDMVIIFSSGQDNDFLEYDFNIINTLTNKVFVFSSNSQTEIFNVDGRTINLDIKGLPITNHYRHLLLMYYINLIYFLL